MRDRLNRLEESRNFSAGVLQVDLANKTISIVGRGLESQMLFASSLYSCSSSSNGEQYIPCLLIVSPGIGL